MKRDHDSYEDYIRYKVRREIEREDAQAGFERGVFLILVMPFILAAFVLIPQVLR